MTSMLRKSVLGVTGLVFAGGLAAGPALANEVAVESVKPVAVVQVDKPAGKSADKAADKPAVDKAKLVPHGVRGEQSRIELGAEQQGNVREIVAATKAAGLDERAAVVAVATSLQESKLENLGHLGDRNDHDSQGLFQQRPSSGWGSVEQITDARYSTTAFLKGLEQVDGWRDMPLTAAAQKVQVSAFPDHYAQWESMAADLVAANWNS